LLHRAAMKFLSSLTIALAACGGVESEDLAEADSELHGSSGHRGQWRRVLLCGTYRADEYHAWVDVDDDPATNEGNSRLQLVVNDPNIQGWLGIHLVYAFSIDPNSSARWMRGAPVFHGSDVRALVGPGGFLQAAVARRYGNGMRIDIESSDAGCRLVCDGEFDSGGGCTTGWREECPSSFRNWWFNDCRETS
jgi:hypothetical protein